MDASMDVLKKKLQSFLSEMLKMGTVKGFKHFAMYIRGREELSICIVNTPRSSSGSFGTELTDPIHRKLSASESLTSQNLPYDTRTLMLSHRTQMSLSGMEEKGVGLPPASPSDNECQAADEDSTIFLIAGYARYSCPYVWVRSNHERLVKLTGSNTERDNPLRLKSTAKWTDSEVYIWDVVAELVKLCTYPAPNNPFEVDLDYLESLPLSERVLATAAMASLLQKILLYTPENKIYMGKVFDDHQAVIKVHFSALKQLVNSQGVPAYTQYLQQTRASQTTTSSTAARRPAQRHYSGPGSRPVQSPSYEASAPYDQYQSYGGYQASPSHF